MDYYSKNSDIELGNVKPIRDIVYEKLKKAITDGKIEPGERIIEKDYAEKLNISRTPIREALRKLEIDGFVEYIPRKGVIVKELSKRDILEIYDIRDSLESLAIVYTIRNITEDELSRLRSTIVTNEDLKDKESLEEVLSLAKVFNETILQSCRMPRLINMISTLQKHVSTIRQLNMRDDLSRVISAMEEHNEILLAIEQKDVIKTQEAVKKHLESSKNALLKKLD